MGGGGGSSSNSEMVLMRPQLGSGSPERCHGGVDAAIFDNSRMQAPRAHMINQSLFLSLPNCFSPAMRLALLLLRNCSF